MDNNGVSGGYIFVPTISLWKNISDEKVLGANALSRIYSAIQTKQRYKISTTNVTLSQFRGREMPTESTATLVCESSACYGKCKIPWYYNYLVNYLEI